MMSLCVSGFSDALDWRHCFFQEPVVEQSACALCKVVSRKAVRLSCTHLLCAECHEKCIIRGSTCPLDGECFADDSIVRLDVSKGYIEKRTVACWNTAHGCDFVCPTSSLLEHYRQCKFHIVSCTRCHSSVLRSEIVDHYKDGCSMSPATPATCNDPTIPDYGEIQKTGKELLEAMLKIAEDLHCLHTGLNFCREDVRATDRSTKELFESQNSTLSEQFAKLSRVCSKNFEVARSGLSQVAFDLGGEMKAHTSKEFCAQSERLINVPFGRPALFHWYLEDWAAITAKALETGGANAESPFQNLYGYKVYQHNKLFREEDNLIISCSLNVSPGDKDSMVEWRFSKSLTGGVIHPRDTEKKVGTILMNSEYTDNPCRKRESGDRLYAFLFSSSTDQLESEGFIEDDRLHIFIEIGP